ncbi:MAG: glycine--tRNA ligase subunit beta [Kangiellaceae bacterium]|nr:glycine--tRNA ligase subunit beta [Kangiellaceae bacterium]
MSEIEINPVAQDFLFELGCEELPPKALSKLASSLHQHLKNSFNSAELKFKSSEWFATPRRLAVRFRQLDIAQSDKNIEKLGPAVAAAFDDDGNPKPAAIGFAKSNGVSVFTLSRKQTDKGERLAFIAEVKGEKTSNLMQEFLHKAVAQLPIPKMMRWGNSNNQFSRPVHWLLAIQGNDTLNIELFNIKASNQTFGHRFHAPEPITINTACEYESKLMAAHVVARLEERQESIRVQVERLAQSSGATAVIDKDLLEEVAALVEWPVALLGKFEKEFLHVPSEALISSMAEHQKYFHLIDSNDNLLPNFITISNIESKKPQSVIDGNEKVIRPRLADAKFFYDSDCKNSLESYIEKLKKIVFQNKLGSLYDKSKRVKVLSEFIAKELSFDQALTNRAAELCKCDLMTDMVVEFSYLHGIMGRYYADKDNEPNDVAAAMDEIYIPRFAGDQLPKTNTGLTLAIAERIDTLVGIFGIGQIPTGAKDPFALRRAALGVIRLIAEKQLDLDLSALIDSSIETYSNVVIEDKTKIELLKFFAARSGAMYQDKGYSSQVIKSVQAINITHPTDFVNRINAVKSFDARVESRDLAEANKRVKNILTKSGFDADKIQIDQSLFEQDEQLLFETINNVKEFVKEQTENAEYTKALQKLAGLKDPVNQFFDKVMINAEDVAIRNNRLALISELRNLFVGIADVSLLQK